MNKSIKILIKWVIAPLLAIWLFYSLYRQVMAQPDMEASIKLIREMPFGKHASKFWIVIALVFVNWGLEARKWQLLMNLLQPLSFVKAFKSVLCGVTVSLNTPNRIGEYGGRVLFVDDGKRMKAVALSMAGGLAQLIITMLMGCLGLLYFMYGKPYWENMPGYPIFWLRIVFGVSVLITLLFIVVLFKMKWLEPFLKKLPYITRYSHYFNILETIDVKLLLRLLSISFFRYLVFVFQFIFMLQLLQVEQNAWLSFWIITVMFWVLAIVPSFAIAELGIRGTVAKAMFSYSANTLGILTATFGIWFANLFVPALIGSLLILGIKINHKDDQKL